MNVYLRFNHNPISHDVWYLAVLGTISVNKEEITYTAHVVITRSNSSSR